MFINHPVAERFSVEEIPSVNRFPREYCSIVSFVVVIDLLKWRFAGLSRRTCIEKTNSVPQGLCGCRFSGVINFILVLFLCSLDLSRECGLTGNELSIDSNKIRPINEGDFVELWRRST